jgi:hypothetical protein
VVGRLLECPRLLIPLGPVAPEAFPALRAPLRVEPRERDRLAAGVDSVHQRLVWSQLRLAAQCELLPA